MSLVFTVLFWFIPSSFCIHCFEFLLPFFLRFTQVGLSTVPPPSSTRTMPCQRYQLYHVAKFNASFSFLILLEPAASCDIVDHVSLLHSDYFIWVFWFSSSLDCLPVVNSFPHSSHLPLIYVLLWGSFYRPLLCLEPLPQ